MKKNGNNLNISDYYIGLDVGTGSVGWAVTGSDYNVLRFKGNAMWGVRLFDEAQDASVRRTSRTVRRRIARRNQRLMLLQLLFAQEIAKVDPNFIIRMSESALHEEDKFLGGKYSLFADRDYTDKDYYRAYPTIYHLRAELAESNQVHDVRLVYLALHHIIKHRGHFLYENADNGENFITLASAFAQLCEYVQKEYDTELAPQDEAAYLGILERGDLGISAKKKALRAAFGSFPESNESLNLAYLSDMLAGASVNFCDLFCDALLKQADIKSFSLKNSIDDNFDALSETLGERIELLIQLKTVYDAARLSQILGGKETISRAKIALYEKNRCDLRLLKSYVRKYAPKKYKLVFSQKKDKLANYAAYSRYRSSSGDYACTQEEFCKFLKKELPLPKAKDTEMQRIFREIQDISFLSRLKGNDNGVIPYQLHKQELLKILENVSSYLPFINETDGDGFSVKEKIVKIFEHRIPYYVGPLHKNAANGWIVRFAGKEAETVYPWNFEEIIDTEASAAAFIENLIGLCTYTGEKVLPKDSLLYSEYSMLNEINLLKVNGRSLPRDVMDKLIQHFFYEQRRKVTKKQIKNYLLKEGLISAADEISGIDDSIKSSLRSWHDFKNILEKTGDYDMVESIIRSILVFGNDKTMLRRWMQKNTHGLDENDIKYVCRLKYNDWGRFSEFFLTGIRHRMPDGAEMSIMDMLRRNSCNLMNLMNADYSFAAQAEEHLKERTGSNQSLNDKLDALYIAPAVRRSIRQTLRIVDEIVDIRKAAPTKIFIEMARGSREELKNKRTESRKAKLTALYKACGEESSILFKKLEQEDDNSLRRDKLYLYYMQLGKCMYSGEPIEFADLANGEKYDIDHIFPRSRIKDNSLDNRVLVKNTLNREKTNIYPISQDIRTKMLPMWTQMKKDGLISQKKFERLSRNYPLTDKELSDFVARQLVETQQSTKALAQLLRNEYPGRIVYSKAGNVSDFRHDYDMLKCRDINDLHHAKDAYLNIVVGNVYCTKFTDRFFANIDKENYSLNRVFDYNVPHAWDKTESIKTVKKYMAKNNILVTRMPREVKGQLFDLQIVSAGKGQLPKKEGMSVEKYGGYNKLTGAYFCAVEFTDKKKRARALMPVYAYKKELYEKEPLRYCTEILSLEDPVIIAPKIRMDAMLELDGKRLLISGRSGNQLIYKHTYQLVMDSKREKYIRDISKYVERCALRKEELPVTEHDGLSAEENMDMFDFFIEKCGQKVYESFLKNMKADMVSNRTVFEKMSVLGQCKLLLEVLKAFRCDATNPNFKELCGKGTVGRIALSSNLSNFSSAYLINQSVTGLFETSVDLLG